jgi:hypothetical protein
MLRESFRVFRRAEGSLGAEILQNVEGARTNLGRYSGKPWRREKRRSCVEQPCAQRVRIVLRLNS